MMETRLHSQLQAARTPSFTPVPAGALQRKCSCGQHTISGGGCSERAKKNNTLQLKASSSETANDVPTIVHQVLRSSGEPLDDTTRGYMEPRFGHDFSGVRVHSDTLAAESAQAVNALAYTVGRDVVFGAGQFVPGTNSGRKLLAHELTHVVQQSANQNGNPNHLASPSDDHERQADQIASSVMSTSAVKPIQPASIHSPAASGVQRLIRTSMVNCPAGRNPFSADRRASSLLGTALSKITAAEAARAADPTNADVVLVGNSLRSVFQLNPADEGTWTEGAPQVRLPVIKRRMEIVKSYIDSVVFTANCCEVGGACPMTCGTCGAENAFTCDGDATAIAFCPPFWSESLNLRGWTLAHEIFHVTFGFIEDWEQPNLHNAHCYAQFLVLLNGFNAPTGLRCS